MHDVVLVFPSLLYMMVFPYEVMKF